MADRTVRVENFPNTESGSPQRVALDLAQWIARTTGEFNTKDAALDLFAECLEATWGRRTPKAE